MTVKEANAIVKQNEECREKLFKGECDRFHCVLCEKDDFQKSQEVRQMAFRSLEAWEKVIDAINNLDEHDYCRCEGANIPPMIDKEDVLTIIKMNLCEVENEQTKR